MFAYQLRVTIQQIGHALFAQGDDDASTTCLASTRTLLRERARRPRVTGSPGAGIVERVDDYYAVDFVYCRTAQAVDRVEVNVAAQDLERRRWEPVDPMEAGLGWIGGGA